MSRIIGTVDIGDVLVTREGNKLISGAIRLGARLGGLPAFCNHVIIVHHRDAAGTLWGIEGRPGGVGWRDLSGPLSWALTNANNQQPKTEEQRYMVAAAAEGLLHQAYDWGTIAEHTRVALWMWREVQSKEWKDDEVPSHVVCSSLVDWAYEKVGLKNPGGNKQTRMTSPGHWDRFIINEEWK